MDPTRFDALARSLAAPQTRRGLLGSLAALGAGLAAGRAAAAAPAGKVGVCHRTTSSTNPYEYIEATPRAAAEHQAHGDAVGVDLQTDPNNCGACGTVCAGDVCNTPVCRGGTCTTTAVVCPDDGNVCTDVSCVAGTGCVPTNNTAACMTTDREPGTCAGGFCVCTPQSNTQTCTSQGRVCGPATNNCGGPVASCGGCDENEECTAAGRCVCPTVTCGDACCAVDEVCIGLTCSPRAPEGEACDTSGDNDCATGLDCCNGVCRDLQINPDFCGSCSIDCPQPTSVCQAAALCVAGVCGYSAAPSGTVCRASAGPCDVPEACVGTACPDDVVAGADVECRPAVDDCDVAEFCDGTSKVCPATDAKQVAGTACTTSGGVDGSCDAGGTCVPFFCAPNSTRPCYTGPAGTQNVGTCSGGTETCNSAGSAYGPCAGQVLPTREVCDGLDNDCDGAIDDGIVGIGAACSTGLMGNCSAGTTQCINGAFVCVQTQQPRTEICNGLDDDCNGVVDNGATCAANQTCTQGTCTCPNVTCNGACCAPGQVCVGGVCAAPPPSPGTCTAGPTCNGGNTTTCNGRNDCYCFTSATGGAIVCAAGGDCSNCTSDASCVPRYGQGARCVLAPSAGGCGCEFGRACQSACPA